MSRNLVKLTEVAWCERCLRPFDRPAPGTNPNSGWKVCDDCLRKNKQKFNRSRKRKETSRVHASLHPR